MAPFRSRNMECLVVLALCGWMLTAMGSAPRTNGVATRNQSRGGADLAKRLDPLDSKISGLMQQVKKLDSGISVLTKKVKGLDSGIGGLKQEVKRLDGRLTARSLNIWDVVVLAVAFLGALVGAALGPMLYRWLRKTLRLPAKKPPEAGSAPDTESGPSSEALDAREKDLGKRETDVGHREEDFRNKEDGIHHREEVASKRIADAEALESRAKNENEQASAEVGTGEAVRGSCKKGTGSRRRSPR